MFDWKTILPALEKIQGIPMLLVFAAVFIIGFMLKNYTKFNNMLIPWLLLITGIVLSLLLNGFTLAYAIIGMIIAWLTMAFYEQIRNTINFFVIKKAGK